MIQRSVSEHEAPRMSAEINKASQRIGQGPTTHHQPHAITNYAGPCRYCSCPSFAGNEMHCARSSCRHHWNDHDA
jgi:hypothetical protein